MKFHIIEPEVIVGMGDNTEMDSTQHPPLVSELHLELEDWLGDDLMENFPCFIVTELLAQSLQNSTFSGFEISDMQVTLGEYFQNNYQLSKPLPEFKWLKVLGVAYTHDFGINDKNNLVISDSAWQYISERFTVELADVDESNRLDDLLAKL